MSDTIIEGIDYGPLACLVGVWKGDAGTDVSPEPDGDEVNPYYETLVFEAAGDVTNAEEQTLAIVRYHQVVTRKSNDEVFHDQIGYWTWDSASGTIAQSVNIPRVVAVLAGGTFVGAHYLDRYLRGIRKLRARSNRDRTTPWQLGSAGCLAGAVLQRDHSVQAPSKQGGGPVHQAGAWA